MYKPLPEKLTIKQSPIHGLGIYTKDNISQAERLGIIHIRDTRFENDSIRTPLGGYINHSEEPNCEKIIIDDLTWIEAKRNILKDEEITVKYTLYSVND